jgi:hypothetical protein
MPNLTLTLTNLGVVYYFVGDMNGLGGREREGERGREREGERGREREGDRDSETEILT